MSLREQLQGRPLPTTVVAVRVSEDATVDVELRAASALVYERLRRRTRRPRINGIGV
jgi:hypothetical protein